MRKIYERPLHSFWQWCAKWTGLLLVLLGMPCHFLEPQARCPEKPSGGMEIAAVQLARPGLGCLLGAAFAPASHCSAARGLFITLQSLVGHKLPAEGLVKLS